MIRPQDEIFSAPRYDAQMVDAMIEKYCSIGAISSGETKEVKNAGVDVSKRIDAIRKTLSETGGPIFGNVELDIAKKK